MGTSVVLTVKVVVSVISPCVVDPTIFGKENVTVEVTEVGVPDWFKNAS